MLSICRYIYFWRWMHVVVVTATRRGIENLVVYTGFTYLVSWKLACQLSLFIFVHFFSRKKKQWRFFFCLWRFLGDIFGNCQYNFVWQIFGFHSNLCIYERQNGINNHVVWFEFLFSVTNFFFLSVFDNLKNFFSSIFFFFTKIGGIFFFFLTERQKKYVLVLYFLCSVTNSLSEFFFFCFFV